MPESAPVALRREYPRRQASLMRCGSAVEIGHDVIVLPRHGGVPTCQQVVSSGPTRGLASHHGALSCKVPSLPPLPLVRSHSNRGGQVGHLPKERSLNNATSRQRLGQRRGASQLGWRQQRRHLQQGQWIAPAVTCTSRAATAEAIDPACRWRSRLLAAGASSPRTTSCSRSVGSRARASPSRPARSTTPTRRPCPCGSSYWLSGLTFQPSARYSAMRSKKPDHPRLVRWYSSGERCPPPLEDHLGLAVAELVERDGHHLHLFTGWSEMVKTGLGERLEHQLARRVEDAGDGDPSAGGSAPGGMSSGVRRSLPLDVQQVLVEAVKAALPELPVALQPVDGILQRRRVQGQGRDCAVRPRVTLTVASPSASRARMARRVGTSSSSGSWARWRSLH
jgi:hypothetical protein